MSIKLPFSILDINALKQRRLWRMIVLIIAGLIGMVIMLRPHHHFAPVSRRTPAIEVKFDNDESRQWRLTSAVDIKQIKSKQKTLAHQMETTAQKITMMMQRMAQHKGQQEHLEENQLALQALMKRVDELSTLSAQPVAHAEVSVDDHVVTPIMQISIPNASPSDQDAMLSVEGAPSKFAGWLPMGSFFKGVLLNGVEAGTGSHAQANPQPVLMRAVSNALLPNHAHYQLRSCFILGSAYGGLSSERAFIRLARISCIASQGDAVVSAQLHGYVVDADGKIGLRGRLVSRQGEKLGKAMLSGFFASLSGGVGRLAQGIGGGKAKGELLLAGSQRFLDVAGLRGLGEASKELANFYIREAKRLFPVIEVNAGRQVMINLSEGVSLHYQEIK